MQPSSAALSAPDGRRELLFVGLLAGLVGLQLLASGAYAICQRHFWLDEIHTYTLVSDPSLSHSMRALTDGVDYNPPTLFLLQRLNAWCWGEVNELALRSFSLGCVLAAVIGLYLCMRRVVGPWPAVAAAATFWIHPLVAEQAFEARFYAPWCAAIVWYAFFHLRTCDLPQRRIASGVLMCAFAVVICTIHYFGIISLILYWSAYSAVNRPSLRQSLWGFLSTGCGMIALSACLPLYFQQKMALSIPTWIQPPDLWSSVEFLRAVVPLLCLVVSGALCWYQVRKRAEQRKPHFAVTWQPLAGLLGLTAMPLFLIAFSFGVQSVLVPRYAIVAALGFAAAAAWMLTAVPRRGLIVLSLAFFALGTVQLSEYVDLVRERDRERLRIIAVLREHAEAAPIVFESRLDLYPVSHYARDLAVRSRLLDFEDGQLRGFSRKRVVERDVGRRFARHYPDRFRLVRYDELRNLQRFYLVVLPDRLEAGPDYADCEIRRLGKRVFEIVP